jgi:rod shape-determining protein MreC
LIRLSIPVRQSLAKLTLPVLIAAAFGLMLLGKADAVLAERARMALADAMSPIYGALAEPLANLRNSVANISNVFNLASENAELRQENETLRRWQSVALALDSENASLKANLHWLPDPAPSYVTARVVADAGGVYARAVLLSAGPNHSIVKDQVALDDRGLVGRVTEVGGRSVRVLLITDINSRIPVMLEGSRARALLVGTNGARPRLMYWPEGVQPLEGERVVTSAEANVFPAGLPVGVVRYAGKNVAEVQPLAKLDRLEMVRLFDYGLGSRPPPETPLAGAADPQPAGTGSEAAHISPWPGGGRGPVLPAEPVGPMPASMSVPGVLRRDR